jgi:hypothetical protein
MASFWSLLQNNVLDRRRWRTRSELRYEIVYWTEHTYNRRCRQRALGRLTPVEFELASPHRPSRRSGLISHNHRQPKSLQTHLSPQQRDERVDVATLEGVDVALR